jgi:glycosyltransferase involved in cell wall biosynthesis
MDPGLRELTGHHYDFVSRLNSHLSKQGHTVTIYSNIVTKYDVMERFDNIKPKFRSFPYPQVSGEVLDYHHHSQLVYEDLRNIPDADLWIWPSVFSFQVNGIRMSGRQIKSVGCVHVEHNYHHEVYGKEQWLHGQTVTFKLFAMEHKLVQDYLDIGFPCTYAPNPADNVTEPVKTELKTIGFFGHQRVDKGSNNILELVSHLTDEYNIILHDSSGAVRYDHPKVKCYGSVPVLSDLIRQCDLVVLPYDRTKYRKMSSGILCESLSVGIPCVVPSGTTQEDWINITGSGIVFDNSDILEAIDKAKVQYMHIANKAHQTSLDWPSKYGIEKFVNVMMG